MPALSYDEDTDFEVSISEEDVRACSDIDELLAWSEDADAVIEDIKHQIQASALAGYAERAWVYRAGKVMGYMGRAKSRIRSRLIALGWTPAATTTEISKLQQKLAEAKAREVVAVEFFRLCQEGALEKGLLASIEKRAQALAAAREAEQRRKAEKLAEYNRNNTQPRAA